MIGVDWGTTNCRAYRLEGRTVIARAEGPGIATIAPGGFPAALDALIAPWLAAGERRVLLAGMVGSRQGWAEAPYLPCPAAPASLAAAAIPLPHPTAILRLIPGLSTQSPAGTPDVMRGEETQIVGVFEETGADATLCLPGTHSKWVRLAAGRIEDFTTHMTGEAFAALRHHTILARQITEAPSDAGAFRRGLDHAATPGGLLHHLFGVRALGLFDRLPPDHAASFLSGLLIGHEVRAAAPSGPVHLVGTPALTALYAEAIGPAAIILGPDAAAAGLALLAEHVAWT